MIQVHLFYTIDDLSSLKYNIDPEFLVATYCLLLFLPKWFLALGGR